MSTRRWTSFEQLEADWVTVRAERDALKAQRDALLTALEAQEMLESERHKSYFAHDCHWCSDCVQKVRDMRRAAIKGAKL